MRYSTIIFWTILVLFLMPVHAQVSYQISDGNVRISGTSTLHDWESVVEKVEGKGWMSLASGKLQGIEALSLDFYSKSIKSGKNQMDQNTYKALKTEDYPKIHFKLSRLIEIRPLDQGFQLKAEGRLEIAGVSRQIILPVEARMLGPHTLSFKGNYALDMTDFGITPPTAMLGTIKTGKEINLSFLLHMNPSPISSIPNN